MTIISIFHQTPAASSKFIRPLCELVLYTEQAVSIEASSPFRNVLMKFLLRYPGETLEMFLQDNYLKNKLFSRYLEHLIKNKDGKLFRDYLQNHAVRRVINLVLTNYIPSNLDIGDRNELQFQGIRIVALLVKFDDQWLSTQQEVIKAIKRIWWDDAYQARHKNIEQLEYTHWKEPKLVVKILLHYFCHHPTDIDILFQLLRAFIDRFVPEFQFLRDFLEKTVAQNYTVEWKRSAFFRFVDLFPTTEMSQVILLFCVILL